MNDLNKLDDEIEGVINTELSFLWYEKPIYYITIV